MADFRDGIGEVRQGMLDLRADMVRLRDEMRGEIRRLRIQLIHGRDEFDRQQFRWLMMIVVTSYVAVIATVIVAFLGLLHAINQHA